MNTCLISQRFGNRQNWRGIAFKVNRMPPLHCVERGGGLSSCTLLSLYGLLSRHAKGMNFVSAWLSNVADLTYRSVNVGRTVQVRRIRAQEGRHTDELAVESDVRRGQVGAFVGHTMDSTVCTGIHLSPASS